MLNPSSFLRYAAECHSRGAADASARANESLRLELESCRAELAKTRQQLSEAAAQNNDYKQRLLQISSSVRSLNFAGTARTESVASEFETPAYMFPVDPGERGRWANVPKRPGITIMSGPPATEQSGASEASRQSSEQPGVIIPSNLRRLASAAEKRRTEVYEVVESDGGADAARKAAVMKTKRLKKQLAENQPAALSKSLPAEDVPLDATFGIVVRAGGGEISSSRKDNACWPLNDFDQPDVFVRKGATQPQRIHSTKTKEYGFPGCCMKIVQSLAGIDKRNAKLQGVHFNWSTYTHKQDGRYSIQMVLEVSSRPCAHPAPFRAADLILFQTLADVWQSGAKKSPIKVWAEQEGISLEDAVERINDAFFVSFAETMELLETIYTV